MKGRFPDAKASEQCEEQIDILIQDKYSRAVFAIQLIFPIKVSRSPPLQVKEITPILTAHWVKKGAKKSGSPRHRSCSHTSPFSEYSEVSDTEVD